MQAQEASVKFQGKIFQILSSDDTQQPTKLFLAISDKDRQDDTVVCCIVKKSGNNSIGKVVRMGGYDVFYKDSVSLHANNLTNSIGEVGLDGIGNILRQRIEEETRAFFEAVHKPKQEQCFIPGETKVNYAGRVFNHEEMVSLIDASLEFYLTAGRYDEVFCKKLIALLKSKAVPKLRAITVNSGSSANLVAVTTLRSPKLGEQKLNLGDEVITVAAGFPTTVAPIIQNGLCPVFVDVELSPLNIDASKIEQVITSKTKAIFVAHTLGIPFDLDAVLEIAEKHKLWVIEDNCDALGAEFTLKREYRLIGNKRVSGTGYTGTFGHVGTSSFYPAHQITMGEGGAVYTSNAALYRIMLSIRDWGRDCYCEPGKDNTCGRRFDWQLGLLPEGYDHKYSYSHLGYNLKITDMQAAIGQVQLDRLPLFAKTRFQNWRLLLGGFADLSDYFILPTYPDTAKPSPFGFALTVKADVPFTREDITSYLEEKKIQTRTVFSGNILRQPAMTDMHVPLRINNSSILWSDRITEDDLTYLPNTDMVMRNTFWVGVFPGLSDDMIQYIIDSIHLFIKRY